MVGHLRIYIIDEHMTEAVKELWNEAVSCTMNMPENDDQEKRIYEACFGRQLTSPHTKICWFQEYPEHKLLDVRSQDTVIHSCYSMRPKEDSIFRRTGLTVLSPTVCPLRGRVRKADCRPKILRETEIAYSVMGQS